MPTADELGIGAAPYLGGLADTVGELRRFILDALRTDDFSRCEELLDVMDEIYTVLVTMDYPDAVTRGLRRSTDMVRGILERTRGDLTVALRQRRLEERLAEARESIQLEAASDEELQMSVSNGMRPVHPGEILGEELQELGMSANALAAALGVPTNRITAILKGQRGITADTALRLSRYLGTTPQLWLNLQKTFELRTAEIESGKDIEKSVRPREMAQAAGSVSE